MILKDIPQWRGKLWRGKKRLAVPMVNESDIDTQLLRWAMTVKPGDYIYTCEGCNRKVEEIEVLWANEGLWNRRRRNNTYFLREVEFTDTHGRIHDATNCAYPPVSVESIVKYFREFPVEEWEPKGFILPPALKEALRSGAPITDVHGEFLPGIYSEFLP